MFYCELFIFALSLLVDPLKEALLVRLDLVRFEPEVNLLLRALNAVGAVDDIAANILPFL